MATINDIVLIYLEDSPVSFARVENIEPDHKKDWYQIKLLMLQIPLQVVTWILKDVYINGDDFFMNGKKMRLETVECPEDQSPDIQEEPGSRERDDKRQASQTGGTDPDSRSGGNIISFTDLKKKPRTDPEPDIG